MYDASKWNEDLSGHLTIRCFQRDSARQCLGSGSTASLQVKTEPSPVKAQTRALLFPSCQLVVKCTLFAHILSLNEWDCEKAVFPPPALNPVVKLRARSLPELQSRIGCKHFDLSVFSSSEMGSTNCGSLLTCFEEVWHSAVFSELLDGG